MLRGLPELSIMPPGDEEGEMSRIIGDDASR
jgi:hypothetical protein